MENSTSKQIFAPTGLIFMVSVDLERDKEEKDTLSLKKKKSSHLISLFFYVYCNCRSFVEPYYVCCTFYFSLNEDRISSIYLPEKTEVNTHFNHLPQGKILSLRFT